MIAITGATGQLGQLVIHALLQRIPASDIVAVVRNPAKAQSLIAQGVTVRQADYNDVAALTRAFAGIDKVLLISSSEVGQRVAQHQHVIDAAKAAGVALVAYTSLLHADRSPLALATEHQATEAYLQAAGIPHVLLRNGWCTENYLASVKPSVEHGGFIGSAAEGRIASAARADYAEAAAVVLTRADQAGKVYELAGDEAYTLSELASAISAAASKTIPYINLPQADFAQALINAGLPAPLANLLADSDIGASQGGLFDDSHQLSQLIGRPTTPLASLLPAWL